MKDEVKAKLRRQRWLSSVSLGARLSEDTSSELVSRITIDLPSRFSIEAPYLLPRRFRLQKGC
jgi:hypothetical protein